MSTYVLVHGGWHGGWAWGRVAGSLRQAGHRVFTPTLSGLAERSHLRPETIDLTSHVEDVAGVLRWEELSDVILCAHSYGGLVATCVADRVPHLLRGLVYVDAFVGRDGVSLLDLLEPDRRELLREVTKARGDGLVPPPPAQAWDVEASHHREWIDRLTTPQPLGTFVQEAAIAGRWQDVADVTYVVADRYHRPTFKALASTVAAEKEWRIEHVPCGHEVMVEQPGLLTSILLAHGHPGPRQS